MAAIKPTMARVLIAEVFDSGLTVFINVCDV
jgi:hypothetical protein